MIRQEIVKHYISSLKEDGELDYIFPLLLKRMGFRVLSTPKQSKGQSQYGRDVVAVKTVKGVDMLFLFELKGFVARDITDRTLNEKDGLIESMRASKNTKYRDASIKGLNKFRRQYVYVHNGYAEANAVITLNDFVEEEFPDGNFERWDLDKLTSLFSKYLFDETLLADDNSYRLFKKVLVLLDAEGNDFKDLVTLIDCQIAKIEAKKNNERVRLNFFATLRLIAFEVYYYAQEDDNLFPAKYCIDTIVLKTWAWMLREKKEKKKAYLEHFNSLVLLQMKIYEDYLNKIISASNFENGLFSFDASDTECVFYPLRCYDFLGDLIYFFELTEAYQKMSEQLVRGRLQLVDSVVDNNSACTVPLLDTHSIPILMVFRYLCTRKRETMEYDDVVGFVSKTVVNMTLRYKMSKMWPELYGNKMALAKSIYNKSDDYCCTSSTLLMVIFELIVYLNLPTLYLELKKIVEESGVSLQVVYPIQEEYDIEQLLFEHQLDKELSTEVVRHLPASVEEFRATYRKKYNSIRYRTDEVNYDFLRLLAHKYYETDFFPDFLGRKLCDICLAN